MNPVPSGKMIANAGRKSILKPFDIFPLNFVSTADGIETAKNKKKIKIAEHLIECFIVNVYNLLKITKISSAQSAALAMGIISYRPHGGRSYQHENIQKTL